MFSFFRNFLTEEIINLYFFGRNAQPIISDWQCNSLFPQFYLFFWFFHIQFNRQLFLCWIVKWTTMTRGRSTEFLTWPLTFPTWFWLSKPNDICSWIQHKLGEMKTEKSILLSRKLRNYKNLGLSKYKLPNRVIFQKIILPWPHSKTATILNPHQWTFQLNQLASTYPLTGLGKVVGQCTNRLFSLVVVSNGRFSFSCFTCGFSNEIFFP